MDYLAYDAHSGLLFVPASNTGKLDVIDTRTGKLRSVDGWPTTQRDDRIAGITGDHRGGIRVRRQPRRFEGLRGGDRDAGAPRVRRRAFDARRRLLRRPHARSVGHHASRQLAASAELEGPSESDRRGNDPARRAARGLCGRRATGNRLHQSRGQGQDVGDRCPDAEGDRDLEPECGEKGPRGIVVDPDGAHVFVACFAEGLREFGSNGKILARLETGAGVDNIDWFPPGHLVYVASAQEGSSPSRSQGPRERSR